MSVTIRRRRSGNGSLAMLGALASGMPDREASEHLDQRAGDPELVLGQSTDALGQIVGLVEVDVIRNVTDDKWPRTEDSWRRDGLGEAVLTEWEKLLAVAWLIGEHDRLAAKLARSDELLAGARAQCERRIADLAEAQVSIRHLQREAVVGHFVIGIETQIRRLRRLAEERRDDFPTGMCPAYIADVVSGELAEVRHEAVGWSAVQRRASAVVAEFRAAEAHLVQRFKKAGLHPSLAGEPGDDKRHAHAPARLPA